MDPKIDVPQPVREFAQNSVDQAEKALASFMEAAGKSAAMVPTPMANVAKQALSITEANLGRRSNTPGNFYKQRTSMK